MRTRRHVLAALAACAVFAVPGCGSDDEPEGEGLPRDAVAALESRLDEVQKRYDDALANDNPGACDDIQTDSFEGGIDPGIDALVAGLPGDVDPQVRQALERSLARLEELTARGCEDVEAPPEPEPVPLPEPVPEEELPDEEDLEQEDGGSEPPDRKDDDGGDDERPTPPGQDGVPPGLDDVPPAPGGGGGVPAPQGGDDG